MNLVWGICQTVTKQMFAVKKTSFNMLWEYSPSSANLASDWLRAKTALLWMKKKGLEKKKVGMTVNISLALEGTDQYVDLWVVQPCLWDPE